MDILNLSRGLVAVGSHEEIAIYALNSKTPDETVLKAQLPTGPSCFTFDKDDAVLASGAENGSIKLWNIKRGEATSTLSGHRTKVTSLGKGILLYIWL